MSDTKAVKKKKVKSKENKNEIANEDATDKKVVKKGMKPLKLPKEACDTDDEDIQNNKVKKNDKESKEPIEIASDNEDEVENIPDGDDDDDDGNDSDVIIEKKSKKKKANNDKDSDVEIIKQSKRKHPTPIAISSQSESDCSVTDIRKRAKSRKKSEKHTSTKSEKQNSAKSVKNKSTKSALSALNERRKKSKKVETEEEIETRKNIHKIMDKSKLSEATKTAAQLEEERRKRIEERQQKYNGTLLEESVESIEETPSLILEKADDGTVLVDVHDEIAKQLKPHQKEAVQFLYECVIESVEALENSRLEENSSDKKDEADADNPEEADKKEALKKSLEKKQSSDYAVGGCILAHCMGLGKTLSLISFMHTMLTIEKLNMNTCLVICPVNTALNWKKEWEMWMPSSDLVDIYEVCSSESKKYKLDIIHNWKKEGGVLIIGYEMFRLLSCGDARIIRRKIARQRIYEALVDPGPDFVVCDEGHLLKNYKSSISKLVNKIKTQRRIVLTGTPLQNKLLEYHTMVHFVKPNLLGTQKEFLNRFVNPINNGQHIDSTDYDVKIMKKRSHILFKTLDGCVHRRDYSALVKYLPAKYEYVIKIRLSDIQIQLYQAYLSQFRERSRNSLFRDQQTLARIWTHPYVLCMYQEIQDRKMLLEESDDSFIDDDENGDDSSVAEIIDVKAEKKRKPNPDPSVKEIPLQDKIISLCSDDDNEVISLNGDDNVATKQNGGSNKDSDDSSNKDDGDSNSSVEEVVKCWKTRSQRGVSNRNGGKQNLLADSDDEDNNNQKVEDEKEEDVGEKHWWSEIIKPEHEHQIEISGKMVVLFQILRKASDIGDKVILFSQSLLVLDIIEKYLAEMNKIQIALAEELKQQYGSQPLIPEKLNGESTIPADAVKDNEKVELVSDLGFNSWEKGLDYDRMDGSTQANTRADIQAKFNREKDRRLRLFLISTKAGGIGINLVAANRVIIFDVSWNPSQDIQAIFRTYRFGQVKPVYVYRLVAQGSMEEKMYERQVVKQSLALRVVDEQQISRHFSEEDLRTLYKFDPDVYDESAPRKLPMLPKDRFLAELITDFPQWISTYHEHDSLLQNKADEELTEADREEAWREFEEEKTRGYRLTQQQQQYQQQAVNMGIPGSINLTPEIQQFINSTNLSPEQIEVNKTFHNMSIYYPTIRPLFDQNYQNLLTFVINKKPELVLNQMHLEIEIKAVFLRSLSKLYGFSGATTTNTPSSNEELNASQQPAASNSNSTILPSTSNATEVTQTSVDNQQQPEPMEID